MTMLHTTETNDSDTIVHAVPVR